MTEQRTEQLWLKTRTDGRRVWLVRLTAVNACWVDFGLYSVCYEAGGVPQFLPKGSGGSIEDARQWDGESEAVLTGHVKWDGCSEFEGSNHVCHGANSYAELHAVIQFALEHAHDTMTKAGTDCSWQPIDAEPLLAASGLAEVTAP